MATERVYSFFGAVVGQIANLSPSLGKLPTYPTEWVLWTKFAPKSERTLLNCLPIQNRPPTAENEVVDYGY